MCPSLIESIVLKMIVSKGGGKIMEEITKIALIALVIGYIVSPVDLCPGPLDDIIVALMGLACRKLAD